MVRREWYVYLPTNLLVLSGHATSLEAQQEADRVERELGQHVMVLPRSDARIREYARTHPAWAKREGFPFAGTRGSRSGQAEVYPEVREGDVGTLTEDMYADDTAGFSHRIPAAMEVKVARVEPKFIGFYTGDVIEGENYFVTPLTLEFRRKFRKGVVPFKQATGPTTNCPVCDQPIAGGPEEYLGHIKTKHPEEWRRLKTDPSYTLRRASIIKEKTAKEIKPEEEEIFSCIDCGKETEPMDIPLCSGCAEKYDLERLWKDHDQKGYPEPWHFIESVSVRKEYLKQPQNWSVTRKDGDVVVEPAPEKPVKEKPKAVSIVRQLPTVTIRGKKYYLDARLREYRAVDDPHDRIPLEPEYAKLLGEASEGSVAWNAVVESIIEEKQREAEQARTGILRCRYCGAPYLYRENLELHERGCPKRRAGY